MFGFGPFSESTFSDLSEFVPGQWVPDPIVLNTWVVQTEVPNTWTAATEVPNAWNVVIVDLANPWQNVSTASNTWS